MNVRTAAIPQFVSNQQCIDVLRGLQEEPHRAMSPLQTITKEPHFCLFTGVRSIMSIQADGGPFTGQLKTSW